MKKYIIIIPVYNDWQSVLKLIDNIDLQINNQNVDIIIINDASTEAIDGTKRTCSKINSVKVLNLINNIGHCQGIATALQYCNTNLEFDYIIPMDGDGEDRPEELNNFFSLADSSSPEMPSAITTAASLPDCTIKPISKSERDTSLLSSRKDLDPPILHAFLETLNVSVSFKTPFFILSKTMYEVITLAIDAGFIISSLFFSNKI